MKRRGVFAALFAGAAASKAKLPETPIVSAADTVTVRALNVAPQPGQYGYALSIAVKPDSDAVQVRELLEALHGSEAPQRREDGPHLRGDLRTERCKVTWLDLLISRLLPDPGDAGRQCGDDPDFDDETTPAEDAPDTSNAAR